jgi:catechol 2,3-dioxygenase-like lactoylglutathione lyase family enzyme
MTDVSGGSEPAVRVSKLGYVQFTTPDVDRLVDYYTKVLDFELVEQAVGGGVRDLGVGRGRGAPPARGRV